MNKYLKSINESLELIHKLNEKNTLSYISECDMHFCLIDGTPVENDMHFCPKCRNKLIVKEEKLK